ncbi:MAG: hypothetical protein JXR96_01355 [Deltaproteobacteria bacterium]|nr:hypothetical protein [Deltaproteobacteria bacterium]
MHLRAVITALVLAACTFSLAACGRSGFDATCPGCDDGVACTRDSCRAGVCEHVPDSSLCPAGSLCVFDGVGAGCVELSNIPASVAEAYFGVALEALDLSGASSPVTIDGDSGEIRDAAGSVFRAAGTGEQDGVGFDVATQAGSSSSAAVFSFGRLRVPEGIEVVGIGANPLVLFARDWIEIDGQVDVGARRELDAPIYAGDYLAGPGGHAGGGPGQTGEGEGGGGADGGTSCGTASTSGGGGGGHGGVGGRGGDGANAPEGCPTEYIGGDGGAANGNADLQPLCGGSGGGGGGIAEGGPSVPGSGGAGGGALQLSSLAGVLLGPAGVVTAPGGGGGGGAEDAGGGGGGGAGGAILIDAAVVVLGSGSVLAANGGGGGSGDCS